MILKQLKEAIRSGPYAWPGGYPMFAIMTDGGALCFDCLRSEWREIVDAHKRSDTTGGWMVEGLDINWESADLTCDHCSKEIESAYGGQD